MVAAAMIAAAVMIITTSVIVSAPTVIVGAAAVIVPAAAAIKPWSHDDAAGAPRHATSVDVTVKSGSAPARGQGYV